MCSAEFGNLVSLRQQIAAGQVDRAWSCVGAFASAERLGSFHLSAYRCFSPALAVPSALRHSKMQLLSQFSHKFTSFKSLLMYPSCACYHI